MSVRRLLGIAPLLLLVSLSIPSCRMIKMKLGIGDKVTNPDQGTPEYVVQQVLKAASMPDEEEGWERFSALLHSEELDSPVAMNDWRNMRFPAIRRKVDYLLEDKASYSFVVMDRREEPPSLLIYLKNKASELPTPCKLRRDPAAGNNWRVFNACF